MNLTVTQKELKKRWPYEYTWYRKQNNACKNLSSFIYKTPGWETLNKQIVLVIASKKLKKKEFFQYCCNRWFNFWSATAVEHIFAEIERAIPNKNPRNRVVDLNFFGKYFDLKISIFSKSYWRDLSFARKNFKNLISWLYKNQSKQGRFHLENRLFLIVYAENEKHSKLKVEISWLKQCIEKYGATFESSYLKKFPFQQEKTTFPDIIWAVK